MSDLKNTFFMPIVFKILGRHSMATHFFWDPDRIGPETGIHFCCKPNPDPTETLIKRCLLNLSSVFDIGPDNGSNPTL